MKQERYPKAAGVEAPAAFRLAAGGAALSVAEMPVALVLAVHPQLTRRQAESLYWLAEGKSNWEIGQILGLSAGTVKKHLRVVYRCLGVPNRVAAALSLRR